MNQGRGEKSSLEWFGGFSKEGGRVGGKQNLGAPCVTSTREKGKRFRLMHIITVGVAGSNVRQ